MFSAFFIDRPKFAFVISIVISLAGFLAVNVIPGGRVSRTSRRRRCKVSTTYPGANATVVQEAVAAPIESQVNGVDDMLYMSSTQQLTTAVMNSRSPSPSAPIRTLPRSTCRIASPSPTRSCRRM